MIVEFEPNRILACSPPKWWLYYKTEQLSQNSSNKCNIRITQFWNNNK